MDIKRRDFIRMCGVAPVLMLPGIGSAVNLANACGAPALPGADPQIDKSIKANFGGGFSVRAHAPSRGLTYAKIEHDGNRYVVSSKDLVDWRIVSSSRAL